MNIQFSRGSQGFGRGSNYHTAPYSEALVTEGRVQISFRQYKNNTVIRYKNYKNGRDHTITSKVENFLFNERDVQEFLDLLQIPNGFVERNAIVTGLKNVQYPHTIQVF